jgi:hypothetical protein
MTENTILTSYAKGETIFILRMHLILSEFLNIYSFPFNLYFAIIVTKAQGEFRKHLFKTRKFFTWRVTWIAQQLVLQRLTYGPTGIQVLCSICIIKRTWLFL